MPRLPTLQPINDRRGGDAGDSVVFAVYAPFGSDPVLSEYPNASQRPIQQQALVQSLKKVAAQGVHVCALIDLVDDDSWWVEIPAKQPGRMTILSTWKQDMSHPRALAGFLRHVHCRYPCSDLVLALEGHGAGYLPEIDGTQLTIENITRDGQFEWRKGRDKTSVEPTPPSPPLVMVSPELVMVSPELPATRLPITTHGLAEALRLAQKGGARRPAVIHFNNCFNLSVELLHTVHPYADYATAYGNYNFFTAGAGYPTVFGNLRAAGSATRAQLARWFAETNRDGLEAKGNHPTLGGMVRLADMKPLAALIDQLAGVLVAAMKNALPADRPGVVAAIEAAIVQAQQYDTQPDYHLDVPDQLTDIRAFAAALQAQSFAATDVHPAAAALETAMNGIRVYGSADHPYPRMSEFWDFKNPPLAMNILLPDPTRDGVWDWRTPFYLRSRMDPTLPNPLAADIDFLVKTRWVDFIIEYHREVKFAGLLPARAPIYPVFKRDFKPGGDTGQQPPRR